MSIDENMAFSLKSKNGKRVDPDETGHYKPFDLDRHCLLKYMFWSAGLQELRRALLFSK